MGKIPNSTNTTDKSILRLIGGSLNSTFFFSTSIYYLLPDFLAAAIATVPGPIWVATESERFTISTFP